MMVLMILEKLDGFNDSLQGREAYEKIKNYFRNVAIWLSPPQKLKQMACVAMWNSLYRYPLLADFSPAIPVLGAMGIML